ncbi:MAG: HAD family hydrolase [Actinomycetota bacterium]|nr:HAD family hydrolase [Actinomycetota bacterium]
MTKLVIFDLDGTLIDTPIGIVDTFQEVFRQFELPTCERAAIRATVGMPLTRAFGQLLELTEEDQIVRAAVSQYQQSFRQVVLPRAAELVFPGVPEGLAALRSDGLVLAVATSKFRANADALLAAAGLLDEFDLVVGADEVSQPKPDPEMGRLVLANLAIDPADAIMVGDTTHDLLMAQAAGIPSIAVTYGVHDLGLLNTVRHAYVADSFDEVISSVRRAAAASRFAKKSRR